MPLYRRTIGPWWVPSTTARLILESLQTYRASLYLLVRLSQTWTSGIPMALSKSGQRRSTRRRNNADLSRSSPDGGGTRNGASCRRSKVKRGKEDATSRQGSAADRRGGGDQGRADGLRRRGGASVRPRGREGGADRH